MDARAGAAVNGKGGLDVGSVYLVLGSVGLRCFGNGTAGCDWYRTTMAA